MVSQNIVVPTMFSVILTSPVLQEFGQQDISLRLGFRYA
jgi:hypothetical protein